MSNKEEPLFTFLAAQTHQDAACLEQGRCPKCKRQLVWCRKKFNMGVKAFYDVCPICLPDNLKTMSGPQEAALQIESLQRDLQALASMDMGGIARDIERIQTELSYMIHDMEKSGSTITLDTSVYEFVVERFATLLEEKVESFIDAPEQPPSLPDQVKELRGDLIQLLNMFEYGGYNAESACPYALVDVLKQLDEIRVNAESETSLLSEKESLEKFQNEVVNLQVNLQQVRHVLLVVPVMQNIASDISALSDRYAILVQDRDRKQTNKDDDENEELRKKIEEIERQHAAEVEALRSQLDTILHTTVTANVIAVDSVAASVEEQHETDSVVPAEVVQAEVVETTLPLHRGHSLMTAVAEPVPIRRVINQHTAFINADARALEKLDEVDNIVGIMNVMKENPSSSRVQAAALQKLKIMTRDRKQMKEGGRDSPVHSFGEAQVEENRRTIGNANGIGLILKAMRDFPRDSSVQSHGLVAVGNVARRNKENATKIGKANGIGLVLEGIREFPGDLQVQRNGLFAIYTLAFNNFDHKTSIRELGGIGTIVSAMRQYSEDFIVQRNGLTALGNLCSNNFKNRSVISEMGGIDIVLFAMKRFPDSAVIQDKGCSTIAFFAKSSEIRILLRQRGATTAVKKAASVLGGKCSSVINALHGLEIDSLMSGDEFQL